MQFSSPVPGEQLGAPSQTPAAAQVQESGIDAAAQGSWRHIE